MNLEDILAAARSESEARMRKEPLAKVRRKAEGKGPGLGFARALRARPFSVIAEIKRASPSMGEINPAAVEQAHRVYHQHPLVSAISVLTQQRFFGARADDLKEVRSLVQVKPKPILRKDFIFSEYEVYYSRLMGADAILLMANVVPDAAEFKRLHDLALDLGMDVLCEVHEEHEINVLPANARVCGINARRFKGVKDLGNSFFARLGSKSDTKTDLSTFNLCRQLPSQAIKVAESGMTAENIEAVLTANPFDAALIGTSLLKAGSGIAAQLDAIQEVAERVSAGRLARRAELAAAH